MAVTDAMAVGATTAVMAVTDAMAVGAVKMPQVQP
jgi:hypothetical protein